MRAREADEQGYAEHGGTKIFYEVFGEGEVTILFICGWQILHSRMWKAQVPYLSRHYRVITFDQPGCGRSDTPTEPGSFDIGNNLACSLAVLDATGTDKAIVVGISAGTVDALVLASAAPDRVEAIVAVASPLPLGDTLSEWLALWLEEVDGSEGWMQAHPANIRADYERFTRFFCGQIFPEPHSTKHLEDAIGWTLEINAETAIRTNDELRAGMSLEEMQAVVEAMAGTVVCPSLVIHGSEDFMPVQWAELLAGRLGSDFVRFEGSGHAPLMRDPVRANLVLREFVDRVHPPTPRSTTWTRAQSRPKRALFVSSPIGLGHAQRDVAIARELRKLHPGLQIDWLAQNPVTSVLEANGETIHPASRHLASESQHIESESAEHDLHCFQAFRRMDEILVNNFHVFDDVVGDDLYDLWIGDEAWEIDFFLHENPERKRAAYCWLTDFVGWLPMEEGGAAEATLTSDYNAEMLEQIDRFRRIHDRSIFVGNPDDITPARFGADLPLIREWTEQHFDFSGYVTGFDALEVGDRERLRDELEYRTDEQVCIVTVGGSGVGDALLRKVIESYPAAKRKVPDLRMIIVAGPRIDPKSLPSHAGLEIRAFVPNLYRHLAACDLAVVQGGLTTSMELTANRRPFLYFPLAEHFEQQLLVPHRLDRYGAGRRMDYATTDPEALASTIAEEIGRVVDYRPVETDGAARAAARIAEML